MKLAIATLLLTSSFAYADTATTTPLAVDANDLAIYATAIRIASTQCGASNTQACQIGLNEAQELKKLNAASDTYQAVLKAQADAKAKK